MDPHAQMAYWRNGAEEDMEAAGVLLEKGKTRHGLFFAELAVEKILKAHVARITDEVPPKTHDLLRLADRAGLSLSTDRREFLARFQKYCLECRDPDYRPVAVPRQIAEREMEEAREVLQWLIRLLGE
jgi:HEPN domain-containing protein